MRIGVLWNASDLLNLRSVSDELLIFTSLLRSAQYAFFYRVRSRGFTLAQTFAFLLPTRSVSSLITLFWTLNIVLLIHDLALDFRST